MRTYAGSASETAPTRAEDAAATPPCAPRPGQPAPLLEAMRYSLLAPGKRLRPLLVVLAAEACGGGSRPVAGGLCGRDGPHLLADPRRPAGDGRRRPAPRPADVPQEVRRGAGDPGRRRPADAGLPGAGRGLPARDGRRLLPELARGAGAGRHGRRPGRRPGLGERREPAAAPLDGAGAAPRPQDRGAVPGQSCGSARWPPTRPAAPPAETAGASRRLRPALRPGVPDHRRPARRGGRRRPGRQARRQGRRPRQADLPRPARRRREPAPAPSACAARRASRWRRSGPAADRLLALARFVLERDR